MKNLLILFFLLILVGCTGKTEVQEEFEQSIRSEFQIECIEVGGKRTWLLRCENTEVICYGRYETGLQCKFKGE